MDFSYMWPETKRFLKTIFRVVPFSIGALLIFEHYHNYGYISAWDFLGHEWFGFLLIMLSILSMVRFKWTENKNPFYYAWEKIKYVVGK